MKKLLENKIVLVCEDEPLINELLSDFVTENGGQALTALNGSEAFKLYSQKHQEIDLLITDIQMPVMDGNELINKIRSSEYVQPYIVVISGGENQNKPFLKHIQAYLPKPFTQKHMAEEIERVLNFSVRTKRAS